MAECRQSLCNSFVKDINDHSNIYSKQILTGSYANVYVACESRPALCYKRGIQPHLAALPPLPLALALFTYPLILGRFHAHHPPTSPPPPHHVSILPSSSSSLPASSLSCSCCGVAIATEKCGNTSVLHSARRREGERDREMKAERKRERMGHRQRVKGEIEEENEMTDKEGRKGRVENTVVIQCLNVHHYLSLTS